MCVLPYWSTSRRDAQVDIQLAVVGSFDIAFGLLLMEVGETYSDSHKFAHNYLINIVRNVVFALRTGG